MRPDRGSSFSGADRIRTKRCWRSWTAFSATQPGSISIIRSPSSTGTGSVTEGYPSGSDSTLAGGPWAWTGVQPGPAGEGAPAAPRAPAATPVVPERTLFEIRFRPPRDLLRPGLDPIQLVAQLEELVAASAGNASVRAQEDDGVEEL